MLIRRKNKAYRSREYLTTKEVYQLIEAAASRGRHKERDRCLLLLMFRHGLRASEAAELKWDAIMLEEAEISISRAKNSNDGTHQLQPDEVEALIKVRELYPKSYFVFPNERGEHITPDGISKIIERAAADAGLRIKAHPHMLRHSCGYYLANQGVPTADIQDWLGHRNIQNTVKYTAQNPKRFEKFKWDWD
jgi:type 1 fimbriae regulatory protein FimB/type 1 fimbriae regulatory protein FimE